MCLPSLVGGGLGNVLAESCIGGGLGNVRHSHWRLACRVL